MTRKTAGLFNPVHPWTVQVLGEAGFDYLSKLAPPARAALPRKLSARGMATLVVAGGGALADAGPWSAAGIGLQRSERPAHEVVHELRRGLAGQGAHRLVHGVLLQVHGVGVLIEGPAAAGKSTLALDLVARGHALVADDAVELRRPAPGILLGRCPDVLKGFLEARDLGVVDVRRMYGPRAVRAQVRIDLLVKLAADRRRAASARERLAGRRSVRRLLGEPVPALALSARSRSPQTGDNLAALVEAACLDRRLRLDGIEADAALARRQARAIKRP